MFNVEDQEDEELYIINQDEENNNDDDIDEEENLEENLGSENYEIMSDNESEKN